ncbi:MAG: hypothetical protein LBD20_03215, partial [Spirochaetaceae bacterium]|nr:hypothetical protein [Spirochaetaceae bacterium]
DRGLARWGATLNRTAATPPRLSRPPLFTLIIPVPEKTKLNKRFVFCTILFFSACSLFSQTFTWEEGIGLHLDENMENELFKDFAVPNVQALAMATIYPAAWIGNLYLAEENWPGHFAVGLLGSLTADPKIFNRSDINRIGAFAGLSFRIGGFDLPFDIGLAGIYTPAIKTDERDIWILNIALDLRYRIIRENEGVDLFDGADSLWSVQGSWNHIPSLSFGMGAAYSHVGVNSMLYDMLFADQSAGVVIADTEIFIRLQSYSFWWSLHLSKKLVFWDTHSERDSVAIWYINEPIFYLIPYCGIKLALGSGIIFGTENATNIRGPAAPPEVYTLHRKVNNGLSLSPIVYGGLGIKLFYAALINIGVSYDLIGNILGAQLTVGYSH